jgi:predicted esterase
MLREAEAEVTHQEINTGHQLTSAELDTARTWLSETD